MKRLLRQSSAQVLRQSSAQAWQLPPLQKLFQLGSALSVGDRRARERWEAELVWFRLRYLEADGPTHCLNLLSRPQACGRVALCYQPDAIVSRLYLGVPNTHVRLLGRMVDDFDFSLKPPSLDAAIPAMQKMTVVADLPWDRPFLAHIVDSNLFLHAGNEDVGTDSRQNACIEPRRSGRFLPNRKSSGSEAATSALRRTAVWRLPPEPPSGLTQRLSWSESQLPDTLIASAPDSHRWLLGRSGGGVPLHVAGQVNLYGRQEAVAEWLVHQVTQMVAADPANLVVIDGVGDLVPRLKRKAEVTRLLGKRLSYVDIDGAALTDGFNPLAAVPGETSDQIAARWQHWFQGMNVPLPAIDLLPAAQKEGVDDIPSLRKWLKNVERQERGARASANVTQAIMSLTAALNRLTAQRDLREWLEWPTKSYDGYPESGIFFACKGGGWSREQLLRAVLLAALSMENVRLIVHGLSWQEMDTVLLARHAQVVIGNGPPLPDSTVILTESHARGEAMVADRFLSGNALLQENLSLLTRGEGMILVDGDAFFTSWNGRYNGHQSVGGTRNV